MPHEDDEPCARDGGSCQQPIQEVRMARVERGGPEDRGRRRVVTEPEPDPDRRVLHALDPDGDPAPRGRADDVPTGWDIDLELSDGLGDGSASLVVDVDASQRVGWTGRCQESHQGSRRSTSGG